MLKSILRWLRPGTKPSPQFGPYSAEGWYFALRCNFMRFDGDPLSVARSTLSEAIAEPPELPVLLSCHDEVGVRVLAMVIAALEKDLTCERALIAALCDENETVRRTAAEALLRLNTVDGLAAVVAGRSHGRAVRTGAAQRLRVYGPIAAPAIPALVALINDSNINWRSHMAASRALAAIGQEAESHLVHAIHHGNPRLKCEAAVALREAGMGAQYSQLIQEIIDAASPPETDAEVEEAARQLGRTDP